MNLFLSTQLKWFCYHIFSDQHSLLNDPNSFLNRFYLMLVKLSDWPISATTYGWAMPVETPTLASTATTTRPKARTGTFREYPTPDWFAFDIGFHRCDNFGLFTPRFHLVGLGFTGLGLGFGSVLSSLRRIFFLRLLYVPV